MPRTWGTRRRRRESDTLKPQAGTSTPAGRCPLGQSFGVVREVRANLMHRAVAAAVLIVLVTGGLVSGAATTAAAASVSRVGQVPRQPAGTRVVGSLADTTTI